LTAIVRQFDIVENLNQITRHRFPLAIVLQNDRIPSTSVVVVAPLTDATPALISTRLDPSIKVGGRSFAVIIEELAAVRVATLGRVMGSAESYRYDIVAAIDLLFTGI
jgi:toxin CcdB